jgi:hypothetical protein
MSILPPRPVADLFEQGNYAAVATAGSDGSWQYPAALGLMGKFHPACEDLSALDNDQARFASAVAHWIEGHDSEAAELLENIPTRHAQNLLALVRKPQIRVLGQMCAARGGCADLLTGAVEDAKFHIDNISYHPDDLPNEPYLDIHRCYQSEAPPDFYISQMIEWHLIPPNLQELPCPILGHTADYDLHIQTLYPWLKLFDEMVVTDNSEWQDVSQLVNVPVSTFPKSFCVPRGLPALKSNLREFDLFVSGTVTHPYHPEKARLLHQILEQPDLRLKILNGFADPATYYRYLAQAKVSLAYVRHATALPTRGLEALAMGCALLVQRGSVLTFFAAESEGAVTYDLNGGDLIPGLRRILGDWRKFERRARAGAKIIRQEFDSRRVGSQYLRFLTFLAARPRGPRRLQQPALLCQKRSVLQKGWLPSYNFDRGPVLTAIAVHNHARLQTRCREESTSSHAFIDLARESVLFNYHRAAVARIPVREWLISVADIYKQGLARFPESLVLRFNYIRVLLHFGEPDLVRDALDLLEDTLARPDCSWRLDVLEDVFPWDVFPRHFNYRRYFDVVMRHLVQGAPVEASLCHLILASLYHYKSYYATYYQGFYAASLDACRAAVARDPDFAYYSLLFAEQLIERRLPEDLTEARQVLTRLASGSLLFDEATTLLQRAEQLELAGVEQPPHTATVKPDRWPRDNGPPGATRAGPDGLLSWLALQKRARDLIEMVEPIADLPLQPCASGGKWKLAGEVCPRRVDTTETSGNRIPPMDWEATRAELEQLRRQLEAMNSSKFWKLRSAWFRVKRGLRLTRRRA